MKHHQGWALNSRDLDAVRVCRKTCPSKLTTRARCTAAQQLFLHVWLGCWHGSQSPIAASTTYAVKQPQSAQTPGGLQCSLCEVWWLPAVTLVEVSLCAQGTR
jgi:hypothetical protein